MQELLRDFFSFRRMLTPILIQVIFLIGLAACVLVGISEMFGHEGFLQGLVTLIVGPILVRVVCEVLILFFQINDSLTELKKPSQDD